MKKILAVLLVLAMVVGLCACGGSKESEKSGLVVAYSNGYTGNAWRANMVDAFEEEAKALKEEGVISEYYLSNVDGAEAQIAGVQDFINKGVDIICMNNDADTAMCSVIQDALDAGIIVVCAGIAMEPTEHLWVVNAENYYYCYAPMQYYAWKMGYKGDIVHLYGLEGGWDGGEDRKQAVRDVAEEYGMNIIAGAPCSWSESAGLEAMSALLGTYGDKLGGEDVLVFGEDTSFGVKQAYAAAGVEEPIINGEYTYGWLREMQKDLTKASATGIYPPDESVSWLHVGILIAQGYEPNTEAFDEGKNYTITLPMKYVVVPTEDDIDEEWTSKLPDGMEVYTVEEILKDADEKSDNDCLLGHMSFEEIKANYFLKK